LDLNQQGHGNGTVLVGGKGMLQVTGLISGIDVESIIEEVIKSESVPKTRLENRVTIEEAKKEILRDINSNLMILQSRASTLSDGDTLLAKNVSSSNTDILTAIATKDAALGSYEIEVTQLATASELISTNSISQSIDPTRRMVRIDPGKFTIDGLDTEIIIGSKYYDAKFDNATSTISDFSTTLDNLIDTGDSVRIAMSEPLELTVTDVDTGGNQITLSGDVDNYTTITKIEPAQINIDITGNITDSGITATITGINNATQKFAEGDYVRITRTLSTDIDVSGNIESLGVTYSRAKITLSADDFSKFNEGDKIQITDGDETQIVTVLDTDSGDNSITVDTGTIDGYLENYTTITAINPTDGIRVTRSFEVTDVYDDTIEVDTDGVDITNYRSIVQINPKYDDIDITGTIGDTITFGVAGTADKFNKGDKVYIGAELIVTATNANKSDGEITVAGVPGGVNIDDYDKVQLLTSLDDIVADIKDLGDEYNNVGTKYENGVLTITKTASRDDADSFSSSPIRFSQEDTNFIDVTRLAQSEQSVYSISGDGGLSETDTLQDLGVSAGTFTINYFEYEVDDPANHTLGDVIDAINESGTGVKAEIVDIAAGSTDASLFGIAGPSNGHLKFSITNGTLRVGDNSDDSNFLQSSGLDFETIASTVDSYELNYTGNDYELITSKASVRDYAGFTVNPTVGKVTLNGNEIDIDLTTTLDEITTAVTSSNFPKLEAFYDVVEDKISISNDDTRIGFGSDDDTSNLFDALLISVNSQSIDSETSKTTVTSMSRIGAINPNTKLSELSFANGVVDEEGTFKINNIEIAYSPDDTLQDVIDRINSSDANVQASYNPVTDKIELVSTITGNPKIKVESVTATTITLDDINIDQAAGNNDHVIAPKIEDVAYILDGSDFGVYDLTDPESEVYNEIELRQIVHDSDSDAITGNINDVAIREGTNQDTIVDPGTIGSRDFSEVSFRDGTDWDKIVVKRDPATGEQTDDVYFSDGNTLWHYDLGTGTNGLLERVTNEIPTAAYNKAITDFTVEGDYAYVLVQDVLADSRLAGSQDATPYTPDSGNIYQVNLATGNITNTINDFMLGKPDSIEAATSAETRITVQGGDDGYVVDDFVTIENSSNGESVTARITEINRGTNEITINAYLDESDFPTSDIAAGNVAITEAPTIPNVINVAGQIYHRTTFRYITTNNADVMQPERDQISDSDTLTIVSRAGNNASDDVPNDEDDIVVDQIIAGNQITVTGFLDPALFNDYTVSGEDQDARITAINGVDPWISARSARLTTAHNYTTINQTANIHANLSDGNTVLTFSGGGPDLTETINADDVSITSATNDLDGYTQITQADVSGDGLTADVTQETTLTVGANSARFDDGDTITLAGSGGLKVDVDGGDLVHREGTTGIEGFGNTVLTNTFANATRPDAVVQHRIEVDFTDGTDVTTLLNGNILEINGVNYVIEDRVGAVNGTIIAYSTTFDDIRGTNYPNATILEDGDEIIYDRGGVESQHAGSIAADGQITRLRIPYNVLNSNRFKEGDQVTLDISGEIFTIDGAPDIDIPNGFIYLNTTDLRDVADNKIGQVTYNAGANLIAVTAKSHETRIDVGADVDRFNSLADDGSGDVVTVGGVRVYVDDIDGSELVYSTADGSSPGEIDNDHDGGSVTRNVTLIEYENNYGAGRTGNAITIDDPDQTTTITLPDELMEQFGAAGKLILNDNAYGDRTFNYTVAGNDIQLNSVDAPDTSTFVIGNDNTKITDVDNGGGFIKTYFPIAQISEQNYTTIESLTNDEHYQFRDNDEITLDRGDGHEETFEIDSGTGDVTNSVRIVDPATGQNPTIRLTHYQTIDRIEDRDPVDVLTRDQLEGRYEITLRDNDNGLDDTAKFYDGDTLYYRYDGQDHELTVVNGGVNPARVVLGLNDADRSNFAEGNTVRLSGLPAPYDGDVFEVSDVDDINDTITVTLDEDWADYGWWKTEWLDSVTGATEVSPNAGVDFYTPSSTDKQATTLTVEGVIPTLDTPYGRIVTQTSPTDGRQLSGMFISKEANPRIYFADGSRSLRSVRLDSIGNEAQAEDYKLNNLVGQITNLLYVDDAGEYAYVVGSTTNNDIAVIDITDPEDPQDTGERIALTGDVTDTLFRVEDEVTYLYVADGSSSIQKIDVTTNPSEPQYVSLNLAVPSGTVSDFTIVELDNNPEIAGPNNNPLDISETLIYARENDGSDNVHVYNLPSRTDLTVANSAGLAVGDIITLSDDVGKFKIEAIDGNVITIASKQWSSNIVSNTTQITERNGAAFGPVLITDKTTDENYYDLTQLPSGVPGGNDVFAKDNKAYILNDSSVERFLGAAHRDIAFVADGTTDVMVVDMTSTTSMRQHNDLVFDDNVSSIATYGNNLYVIEGNDLMVMDVSDPFGSTAQKIDPGIGSAENIFVFNNKVDGELYAYVVDDTNNVSVYQPSDDNSDGVPENFGAPVLTVGLNAPLVDSDVFYDGDDDPHYLYITDGTSTITTIDLQGLSSETISLPVSNDIRDIAVSTTVEGGKPQMLYVTDSNDKIYVFDISGDQPRNITPATAPVTNREVFTHDGQVFMITENASELGNPGNVIKKYQDGEFPNEFMGILELNEENGDPGDNSIIKVNGDEYERNLNSIDDVIPYVTLGLKDTTEAGKVTLTIESDVDGAVEAVNKFVEQYNTVQSLLRETITEKRIYDPENEEELTQGALANDTTLRSLYQRLQLITTSSIAGSSSEVKSLGDVGLSRGKAGSVTINQIKSGLDLKVNETTLREQLRNNPKDVAGLFGNLAIVSVPSSNIFSYGSTLSEIKDSGEILLNNGDIIGATGSITTISVPDGTVFSTNDIIRLKGTDDDGGFLTPLNLRVTNVVGNIISVYTGAMDITDYDDNTAIIDRIIESTPENTHLAKVTMQVPSGKIKNFLKEKVKVELKESATNQEIEDFDLVGINPTRSTITLEAEDDESLPDIATTLSDVTLTDERAVTIRDILDEVTGDRGLLPAEYIQVSSLRKVGDQIILTVPSTVLQKFMEDTVTVTEYDDDSLTTVEQDDAGNDIVAEELEIASVDTHNNLVSVYVPDDKFLDSSKFSTTSLAATPSETRTRVTVISRKETLAPAIDITNVSYADPDRAVITVGSDIDKFVGKDKITTSAGDTVRIISVDTGADQITVSTLGGTPVITNAHDITGILDSDDISVNTIIPEKTNVAEISNVSVVDLRKYEMNDLFSLTQNGTEYDLTIINRPVEIVDIDITDIDQSTNPNRAVIEVDATDIDKFLGKDKVTVKGSGFVNTVRILSVDTDNNEITVSTPNGSPDISLANTISEIVDTLKVRGQMNSIELDSEITVEGIGERIEELLGSYTKLLTGLIDTRISSIDSRIEDLNEDIEEIEQKLSAKEDELIREFAQLETALGTIQMQSQFLTQQIQFLQNSALFSFRGNRNNQRRGIFG